MTQLSNFSKYFTLDSAIDMIVDRVTLARTLHKEGKSNEHLRELGMVCKMIEDYLQDHGVSSDVVTTGMR